MMSIYLDGMFFRSSGIGRCYENLLTALVGSGQVSRICTVVPKALEDDFRGSFPSGKIDARFVDFSYLGVSDFLFKGFILRKFRPAPDLFYFPNINVPFFWKGRTLSQVNDLIPLTRFSDWPWRHRVAFRRLAERAVRRSTTTVCISEFTKKQLIEIFRVSGDRLRVIHPWVDDGFLQDSQRAGRGGPLVEGDYLLFVGNRAAHKNLKGLIEAFRLLLPSFPDLKVVVVGARMRPHDSVDAAASDPLLEGRIVQYARPSDEQLMKLYAFAKAFVFPTFMEGFGIPPLEAMSFGVPVVCSDIPVIREVCGDAVRYADPSDPGSFAREIQSALSDPGMNTYFREKGLKRIQLYRRENALAQYLDLFRSCL